MVAQALNLAVDPPSPDQVQATYFDPNDRDHTPLALGSKLDWEELMTSTDPADKIKVHLERVDQNSRDWHEVRNLVWLWSDHDAAEVNAARDLQNRVAARGFRATIMAPRQPDWMRSALSRWQGLCNEQQVRLQRVCNLLA